MRAVPLLLLVLIAVSGTARADPDPVKQYVQPWADRVMSALPCIEGKDVTKCADLGTIEIVIRCVTSLGDVCDGAPPLVVVAVELGRTVVCIAKDPLDHWCHE